MIHSMFTKTISLLAGLAATVSPLCAGISVESTLPSEALISVPVGASSGSSAVGSGTTPKKGNSFVLASAQSITSVTFRVAGTPTDTVGSISLDFYNLSGTPDGSAGSGQVPTGASLYHQLETLPTMAADDFITITLASPLNLPAGNYAFILSTADADFNVRLNNSNGYAQGELIRHKTSSDAWEDRANDMVFSIEAGSVAPNPLGNPSTWPTTILEIAPDSTAQSTQVDSSSSAHQTFTLTGDAEVDSVVVQLDDNNPSTDVDGSLTLAIFADDGGGSPTGSALVSMSGGVPNAVSTSSLIEFNFASAVNLPMGDYVFVLSTSDADVQLNATATDLIYGLTGSIDIRPLPSTGPNVVFILVDDWGWTDHDNSGLSLGNASDFYQTPQFSRLVDEGVSFTSAYVQPNCAPTRAALLSGQYSARSGNGVYNVQSLNRAGGKTTYTTAANQGTEHVPGNEQTITIGEAFQNSGYVTAHFGKYHAGSSDENDPTFPLHQGFDYNYGGNNKGNPGNYYATGQQFHANIGPEMDAFAADYTSEYITKNLLPYANGNDPTTLVGTKKYISDAMADAFISFMGNHQAGAMADYPVYVQLHYYAVHGPTGNAHARPDLLTKYDNLPGGTRHNNASYAAIIEGMDQSIGRVMDYLDDPNGDGDTSDSISENTLLIFCSDNGGTGETNAPLRGIKGMHYEGGIRVPVIARMPGTIPAGKISDSLVHAVDFYPTMLDFAGGVYPDRVTHPLDGESLHDHLLDPENVARDRGPIFYHFPGYMDSRAYACSSVIKEVNGKRYKYIYSYDPYYDPGSGTTRGFDQYQLYNLTDDIGETENLLDYIDVENTSDPNDPSTAEEYWNYLLYKDLGNELAADLNAWLIGDPSDTTWNPIHVTYKASYPNLAPELEGQEVAPAPPTIAPVDIPVSESFRVISASENIAAQEVTLQFASEVGFLYNIERSHDLNTWHPLMTGVAGLSGSTTQVVSDPALSTESKCFYRVVLSSSN